MPRTASLTVPLRRGPSVRKYSIFCFTLGFFLCLFFSSSSRQLSSPICPVHLLSVRPGLLTGQVIKGCNLQAVIHGRGVSEIPAETPPCVDGLERAGDDGTFQ